MTASKKPTPDQEEPTPTAPTVTKRPATKPAAVAMDIIPKNKVRPTTTSRPVIAPAGPLAADTTLTQPGGAPLLRSRRRLTLQPLGDTTAEADDSQDRESETLPRTSSEGVSVGELIAKRQHKEETVKEEVEAAEDAPEQVPSDLPQKDADSKEADQKADESVPELLTDAGKTAGSTASTAVDDILKDDPESTPLEHSQALKDEIAGMKTRSGEEPRHELYGGKPVIVIHKERGAMSALAWVLWFVLCLGIALLAVNFLLDAGIITTDYKVPHTNIL